MVLPIVCGVVTDDSQEIKAALNRVERLTQRMFTRIRGKFTRSSTGLISPGISLVSPMILGLLGFVAFPLIFSLILSFYKWDGLSEARFVGAENYAALFADPLFWKSLRITMTYAAVTTPIGVCVGLILALLLNKDTLVNQVLRMGFFVPLLVTGVPLMILWLWIFNTRYGLMNRFLTTVGLTAIPWFEGESSALAAMMIISLWGAGNYMLVFLAAFQTLPRQLVEVVRLEGGSFRDVFRYAIFPYISPIVFFLTVVGFIGSTSVFSEAYVITQGGPNNATLFFVYYVYGNAFSYLKLGYASALAWVFFVVLLIITAIQFIISRFWVSYDEVRIL